MKAKSYLGDTWEEHRLDPIDAANKLAMRGSSAC